MGGKLEKLADAVSDDDNTAQIGLEDMYDEVDRWNMGREEFAMNVMKKNRKVKDKSDMEMFALSGTDSDDSDVDVPQVNKKKIKNSKALLEEVSEEVKALKDMNDEDFLDSDDQAEDENESEEKIEAWGRFKSHFYGGNTGFKRKVEDNLDLSDFSENEAEEKEGRIMQQKQIDRLQEEDFMDAFGLDESTKENKDIDKVVKESIAPDISKLNNKQLAKLFKQQSPEFDGVVLDFKQKIEEAAKLAKIVQFEDQGLLPKGPVTKYVRTKFQILTNYCTNITAYLMFKAKGTNLQLHPVIGRLVEYKSLIDSLENTDSVVQPQVDRLLERLEGGETIQEIVKEEKRRAKKKLKKKQQQSTLKLLEKERKVKFAESKEDDQEEVKAGKKRKAEEDSYNDFTRDERKALDFYEAIKRGRKGNTDNQPEEEQENDEEESDNEKDNAEVTNPLANNDDLDIDEEDEEGGTKRSITMEMAKNRGLTASRNKKTKTPRSKNRLKYDNALKKRKGAVREVRKELSRYGGEQSGINVRVRKGVKIS